MANRRRFLGMFGLDPQRDVEHELACHLEMRVQELVERGESPERAMQIARERFGDYDAARRSAWPSIRPGGGTWRERTT